MDHQAGVIRQFGRVLPLLLFVSILILSGCSTNPVSHGRQGMPADFVCAQKALIDAGLSARGKMAVSSQTQKANGRFSYRFINGQYELAVWGSLGRGHWQLSANPGYAVVTDSAGEKHSGQNAKDLVEELYGWSLPFSALPSWMMGCVAPVDRVNDARFDAEGRLVFLQQGEWQLRFSAHVGVASEIVPGKITATDGKTRIKLVIKSRGFDDSL